NNPTCKGFNAPAGRSETTGLTTPFVFNNITPSATVDEGNNWLNLTYGPLTLGRPNVTTATAPELMVASAAVGAPGGAYSIAGTSPAVNQGFRGIASILPLPPTTARDFFGNPRIINNLTTSNPPDIGAVEYQVAAGSTLVVVNPSQLAFGNVVVSTTTTRDLTVSNNGTTAFVFTQNTGTVSGTGFSRVTTGVTGNCATTSAVALLRTLAAGTSCTIRVQWVGPGTPTTAAVQGSVAIAGNATVINAPVALSASAVAAVRSLAVTPASLAFGNWANGTTSATQSLTVTNSGNVSLNLTGLGAGFGGGTPQPYSRPSGAAGGTCAATQTLDVGASCTINVRFAPTGTTTTTFNRTVSVSTSTSPAVTVTQPTGGVALTGTGIPTRAAVSIATTTITLPTGTLTDTSAVVFTNAAPTDGTGANLTVSGVAITQQPPGSNVFTYFFGLVAGQDSCTGVSLPPGGTCTVAVRFTNLAGQRGVSRNGRISFTDNGAASPQNGSLIGFATP
ncbi:MAG: choice-of-anchor D domain-containing protein, partial [Steroidobacterales bacterium]